MAFEKEKQTIYDSKFEELLGQTRDLIGRENQFQSDPNALSEDDLQLNMVKIFVHLFSDGSVQNWLKLQKFLQFLTDKKVVFKELSEQLEHYTYRLLFQLEFSSAEFTQKNFLSDLKIRVHKIFPKFAFVKLLNAEDFVDYEYKRHRGKQNKSNYFEDLDDKITSKVDAFNKYGGVEMYNPDEAKIRERLFKEKTGLLLRDFDKLIPAIALEIAAEETQNVTQLETIQNSLFGANLLTDTQDQDTQRTTGRIMDMDLYRMPKEPAAFAGSKSKVIPPIGKAKFAPEYNLNSPSSGEMAGVAHAQHLMKANHLKIAKFVYLQPVSTEEPYSLELIDKRHAKGEHYLMSNFGILRVHNDGFVESMSLADWHREALIYRTLRSLKFFKQFKIKKHFKLWRRGANLNKMTNVRLFLEERLLLGTPSFNVAFCHLHKLLMELETVGVVPVIETVDPITLAEFQEIVQTKKMFLQKVLKKFYEYSAIIINTTRDKILEKLQLCEQKVNTKPKAHVKVSLSQQKAICEENERKLLLARREALQLGNFVQLFERYVAEYLVTFTRRELQIFTKKMLEVYSHKDDLAKEKVDIKPYLSIDLTFDLDCKPRVDPEISTVTESIIESLSTIISAITEIIAPFGSTVNPILDAAKGVKPKKGQGHPRVSSSTAGSRSTVNLHRPSGSLNRDLDEEMSTGTARSQMSDALLNMSIGSGLEIIAEGFIGQYEVLSQTDLSLKLEQDEVIQALKSDVKRMWCECEQSVNEYCDDGLWVVPICEFIHNIDKREADSIDDVMRKDLPEVQRILNQTKRWIEQLETSLDLEWVSPELLLKVRQDTVHVYMIPRLNEFIEQVSAQLSKRAMGICEELTQQANLMAEFLHTASDMGVAVFAGYLSEVNRAKVQLGEARPRLDHAHSCLQTIKLCVRALTEEELNSVRAVESTLSVAQKQQNGASEFVRKKRLEMEVLVRSEFQKREEEVRAILAESQSEQFVTLSDSGEAGETSQAMKNVKQLDVLRDKCLYAVKLGVAEAKYLQIIKSDDGPPGTRGYSSGSKGGGGDLLEGGVLWDMYRRVEARRELWKFLQVAHSMITEWTHFKFRLLKTHKVRAKLSQWSDSISEIRQYIPENDPILLEMLKKMDYITELVTAVEFIQDACNDRKTWREAVQKATQDEDVIDLQTVQELIKFELTGRNLSLLQCSKS